MADRNPRIEANGRLKPSDLPAHVLRASVVCQDRNAREAVVLDLRGRSNATDFFLIASGDSDTHVTAISRHMIEALEREGVEAAGVEGLNAGRWVLIDYIDLVVHIMHPNLRGYYQLERLWGDAPMMVVEEQGG